MAESRKIDLKNRINTDKNRNLNGWVSFSSQKLNEKNLDELSAMAELLERVGISLEITRNENSSAGLSYDFIVLKVNKERYRSTITRHAGRKADFNKKYDTYGRCTVAELKVKLQSMTKTKIAEELGCSRMTLYRIIKNIELRNPEGGTSIWHYTS